MEQATTIGLDIAKHVFQVHGADAAGHVLFRKRITRVKLLGFLAAHAPCVVAIEACAGAHYWAREIGKLGHHVRLIAPAYVKPFIKRQGYVRPRDCTRAARKASSCRGRGARYLHILELGRRSGARS
jgi:transposase